MCWLLLQARLQQRLQHASATEQLLQGELTAIKEQLQQAQAAAQELTAAAQASADAAKAMHEAELDKLRQHLGSEGSAQVGQHTGRTPTVPDAMLLEAAILITLCPQQAVNTSQCPVYLASCALLNNLQESQKLHAMRMS